MAEEQNVPGASATTPDPIRAALQVWNDLIETDLICPGNSAETDWAAVAMAAKATRAALAAAPPERETVAIPCNADVAAAMAQLGLAFLRDHAPERLASVLPPAPADAPAVPEDYIDPEHQGEDRGLLEAFYAACNSEGGTADEVTLRGLRAVLARWGRPTTPPAPAAGEVGDPTVAEIDAAWLACWCEDTGRYDVVAFARAVLSRWGRPAPPPAPADGEVGELADPVEWLEIAARACKHEGYHEEAEACLRAAAMLRQLSAAPAAAPAVVAVAVSERPWERPGWCDVEGRCWWADDRSPLWWTLADPTQVSRGWLAPAHALPLPTTTPAGEEEIDV